MFYNQLLFYSSSFHKITDDIILFSESFIFSEYLLAVLKSKK